MKFKRKKSFLKNLLCKAVKSIRMNVIDFVVIEGEAGDLAEPPEGPILEPGDVVLVEVDVVQLPQLSEGHGGDVVQVIVRQDQMFQ